MPVPHGIQRVGYLPSEETQEEALKRLNGLSDLFMEADTNGDGVLDQNELSKLLHNYHKRLEKTSRQQTKI